MSHLPIEQLTCWQRRAERTLPIGMKISLGAADISSVIVGHGIEEATDEPGLLHAPVDGSDVRLWRLVSRVFDETVRLTEEVHTQQLAASRLVPVGAHYEHSKTGGIYRIMSHGITEASREPGILYKNVEHPEVAFWRPISQMLDQVVIQGEPQSRFRRVD